VSRVGIYADSALLRGRCPGPSDDETGADRLALAHTSRGALVRRALSVQLRSRRGFMAGAYRGTRTVRVALRLRRKRARVAVDHVPGEGGVTEFLYVSSGSTAGRRAR
jgi:hypothetical protein